MSQLSRTELMLRFGGVAALTAVAYTHFLDLEHKLQEGIWYMVFGFYLVMIACLALSVMLVRADRAQGEKVWAAAALLCAGAIGAYVLSRLVPLPQMADHKGDWVNTVGIAALLAESAVVLLAAWSNGRRRGPGVRSLLASGSWTMGIALAAILVAAGPAADLAHASPGHDDEHAPTITAPPAAPEPSLAPAPSEQKEPVKKDQGGKKAANTDAEAKKSEQPDDVREAAGAGGPGGPGKADGTAPAAAPDPAAKGQVIYLDDPHASVEFSPSLYKGIGLGSALFVLVCGAALVRRDRAFGNAGASALHLQR